MEDELKKLLENVPRSYPAFVDVISRDVKKNESHMKNLIRYIKEHPEARSDDVIEYVDNELLGI